jgi:hypothetical protein
MAAVLALSAGSCGRSAGSAGPLDARYIPLGQRYLPELGRAYAKAWNEGAKRLENGQSVPAALQSVRTVWEAGRIQLFDRWITPEFSRIAPESRAQSQFSYEQRKALARAWRGFAAGLETPHK